MACLLAVTALIYSRSLGNEFLMDQKLSLDNPYVADWSFIWKSLINDEWWFLDPAHLPQGSYYRPIPNIWLALNFHLFGRNPGGWHAAMIALHLIAVWMAFRVASLLAGNDWTGLLAAALFALMPIHAEAVVYSYASPIAASFELAAFELYLRSRSDPAMDNVRRMPNMMSLLLFGGALLSYESAAAFPLLVAAHAFIFPHTFADTRPDSDAAREIGIASRVRGAFVVAWPFALEVAVYLGIRRWVLGAIIQPDFDVHLSAREAILTIPATIWEYAMLLVTPWRAGPAHFVKVAGDITTAAFYRPLFEIVASAVAASLALRENPRRQLYLFCAAWFLIALMPVLNLRGFWPDSIVQDRYLYLPSFGFCVLAADLAVSIAQKGGRWHWVAMAGAAAVTIAFAGILLTVQLYWHDNVSLLKRGAEVMPAAARWRHRLGVALAAKREYVAARGELETAVALAPDDPDAPCDLAVVYETFGEQRAAVREIMAGYSLLKHLSPYDYAKLALLADATGDPQDAQAALARAAAMPGGSDAVIVAGAQLQLMHGDAKGAEKALRELLKREPGNAPALAALSLALSSQQHYDEALSTFRRAEQTIPAVPGVHFLVAVRLHQLGREPEASRQCAMELRATPNDPVVRALMAAIERSGSAHQAAR